MIIKTWRDPYNAGFSPTKPKEIELNTGLTVIVGCNGAGKSTLINNIADYCKANDIPYFKYNNLLDGGSNAFQELFNDSKYSEAFTLYGSSEGECIKNNISRKSTLFKGFFENGYVADKRDKWFRIFADAEEMASRDAKCKLCKDRVLLFDAVDSGLSIDSVVEIKEMFNLILEDTKDSGLNIYIIIAANEFELARNESCFDVNTGKYVFFGNDYMNYRNHIIKSRILKEKRIEQQIEWNKKQREKEIKEYFKIKEKVDAKKQAFENSHDMENLSWSDKYKYNRIQDTLNDFLRHTRFISNDELETLNKK